MPRVRFDALKVGRRYDRPFLAEVWEYDSFHAIAKGVVTPRHSHTIVLFVTRIKQSGATLYDDYVLDDRLYWDGEAGHGTDSRILNAVSNGDDIHLFYREVHHSSFEYRGRVRLEDSLLSKSGPSKFVFRLEHDHSVQDDITLCASELESLKPTERQVVVAARMGQGRFRQELIDYWTGCSITNVDDPSLLRASHIKPWRAATNNERLAKWNGLLLLPHYDHLFDRGLISFRDSGNIIISPALGPGAREAMRVDDEVSLRMVDPRHLEFLKFHRQAHFNNLD